MPRTGQIVPQFSFPHVETYINDYSDIIDETSAYSSSSGITYLLHVFNSPRGRDNELITITNGLEGFSREYGEGAVSAYGQPFLNAWAAASTGNAVLQCMRVTADDARYSNITIYAAYKATNESVEITKDEYDELIANGAVSGVISRGADVEEVDDVDSDSTLYYKKVTSFKIKFISGSDANVNTFSGPQAITPIEDIGLLDSSTKASLIAGGYTDVLPIFTFVSRGKGSYGKSFAVKFTNLPVLNKQNEYQNYYLQIIDSADERNTEYFPVVLFDEAMSGRTSIYADDVINDPSRGSAMIRMYTHIDNLYEIFKAYKNLYPNTELTIGSFDFLLGVNKYTKVGIEGYEIAVNDTTTLPDGFEVVGMNATYGISLKNGTNGSFDLDNITNDMVTAYNTLKFGSDTTKYVDASGYREAKINEAYTKAFNGTTDPLIVSKTRFPVTIIFDANYDVSIKQLIAALALKRTDCVAMLDFGTNIYTKDAPLDYAAENFDALVDRVHYVLPLYGKIRDPFNSKIATVTWTYLAASAIPNHFAANNGKHVPFAGRNYGTITGFITNTAFPTYEQDIDYAVMEELTDANINFAKFALDGTLCIATQNTRQTKLTDLSELNAVLVLLDVKRDAENLVSTYEYNFNDANIISIFNNDAKALMNIYQGTQVTNIEASFDSNEWESERNILHMYITIVNRNLVKTVLIEIDVNQ